MRRRLPLVPLLCASNSDGVSSFYTEPCSGKGCKAWFDEKTGTCSAGRGEETLYARWFTPARDAAMPSCPAAARCAWDVEALQRGTPGCFVRRLGLVCEHQGGEWNTFDMADPNDPCWADAQGKSTS